MSDAIVGTAAAWAKLEFRDLCQKLDQEIPPRKTDKNLLIATWNIQMFGDYQRRWHGEKGVSPSRDYYSLRCITEILGRFDVIAVQEVRSNLACLRHALELLGPHWGVLMTDVTKGSSGNYERLAFIYDTRRVKPSGLACELVVPPEHTDHIKPATLREQFARTPYAASFQAGDSTFILTTLHVIFGDKPKGRLDEIRGIAEWLHDWSKDMHSWGHAFIALGDFNIHRKDDETYQAFTSTGLSPAPGLAHAPRTVYDDPDDSNDDSYYDQIAWFPDAQGNPSDKLRYHSAGHFDFQGILHRGMNRRSMSFRISDHYLLWTEFTIPYSDPLHED